MIKAKPLKSWWTKVWCRHRWTNVTMPRVLHRQAYEPRILTVFYGYDRSCLKCGKEEFKVSHYEDHDRRYW